MVTIQPVNFYIPPEIQAGLALYGPTPPRLTIIGVPALAALYADALALAGVEVFATVDGGVAAARGLWRMVFPGMR